MGRGAIGAKDVFVMMTLFAKDGSPKLVPTCSYPLTGLGFFSRVYTEHATFTVGAGGVGIVETFGTSYDDLLRELNVSFRA